MGGIVVVKVIFAEIVVQRRMIRAVVGGAFVVGLVVAKAAVGAVV